VSQAGSLPAGIPRRLARRPHLAAALLRWRNAWQLRRSRTLLTLTLSVAGVLALLEIPPTGPALSWLGANWAVAFAVVLCLFALATARHRERAERDAAVSWLAALPAASPARLRAVLRAGVWLSTAIAFILLALLAGRIEASAAFRLSFASAAGALVGSLAGWRLPHAGLGAPGFHHAAVRRARARWATAPSLMPLAYWPAAQGRIFSRPKRMSPVLLIALLSIPSGLQGAPGQVALAVAAACIAVFTLISLSFAAISVAYHAARWLAPTAVRGWRFTAALAWRVVLTQALMCATLILLAGVIDLPRALGVGVPLAIAFLLVSSTAIVSACLRACRRTGLGATGRGV